MQGTSNLNNHCRKSLWLWLLASTITKPNPKQIEGARLNESG